MIYRIAVLGLNTYREAIRNRMLFTIAGFAAVLLAFSTVLGELSVHENAKIIVDMGLSTLGIFGVVTALFSGIGLIYKEIERRTIYNLVSKPVRRGEILLGKFAGLALLMLILMVAMFCCFLGLAFFQGLAQEVPQLFKGFAMAYIEVLLVIALALFFSSFSSPALSALFTIGVYMVGYTLDDLEYYTSRGKASGLASLVRVMRVILPDFERFDIRERISHRLPVTWLEVLFSAEYGLLWAAGLLILAAAIFSRRDFK